MQVGPRSAQEVRNPRNVQAAGDAAKLILKLLVLPKRAISGILDLHFQNPMVQRRRKEKAVEEARERIEEIKLEVNTNIALDESGNKKKQTTTAVLNNPTRNRRKELSIAE